MCHVQPPPPQLSSRGLGLAFVRVLCEGHGLPSRREPFPLPLPLLFLSPLISAFIQSDPLLFSSDSGIKLLGDKLRAAFFFLTSNVDDFYFSPLCVQLFPIESKGKTEGVLALTERSGADAECTSSH